MSTQHELMVESIEPLEERDRTDALAERVSRIFHPIVLSTVSFLLIGLLGVAPFGSGVGWALFCIAIQIVPPTLFYLARLRQGAYSDHDVSERHQRNELYLFTMVNMIVCLAVLVFIGAPRPFIALVSSGVLLNLSSGIINLFWKISVHSASAAWAATTVAVFSQLFGGMLWVAALTVGWSRVRTNNHTPLQVVAGLSVAATIACVVFWLYGLL
jgi:membrane-associated phospholipid phosphatase